MHLWIADTNVEKNFNMSIPKLQQILTFQYQIFTLVSLSRLSIPKINQVSILILISVCVGLWDLHVNLKLFLSDKTEKSPVAISNLTNTNLKRSDNLKIDFL
jgi:hypothetical protein